MTKYTVNVDKGITFDQVSGSVTFKGISGRSIGVLGQTFEVTKSTPELNELEEKGFITKVAAKKKAVAKKKGRR